MEQEKEIKKSLDVMYYRNQLLLFLIFYLIIATMFLLKSLASHALDMSLIALFVLSLIYFPFIGYYLYRLIRILRNIPYYEYYEVMLNEPHIHDFIKYSYFTVTFETEAGKTVKANTKAMFGSAWAIFLPTFDDYFNKKALIAYNTKNEEIIVIKTLEK